MKHIYVTHNNDTSRTMRRRASVAEIKILRRFEGKSLIEDRIDRQMSKLHALWFRQK